MIPGHLVNADESVTPGVRATSETPRPPEPLRPGGSSSESQGNDDVDCEETIEHFSIYCEMPAHCRMVHSFLYKSSRFLFVHILLFCCLGQCLGQDGKIHLGKNAPVDTSNGLRSIDAVLSNYVQGICRLRRICTFREFRCFVDLIRLFQRFQI